MDNLVANILGLQNDDGTREAPDDQGLTTNDRFQTGMSSLGSLGAMIAAVSAPQTGAQRAQAYAGLAALPAQNAKLLQSASTNRFLQSKTQDTDAQRQLRDQQARLAMSEDDRMQALHDGVLANGGLPGQDGTIIPMPPAVQAAVRAVGPKGADKVIQAWAEDEHKDALEARKASATKKFVPGVDAQGNRRYDDGSVESADGTPIMGPGGSKLTTPQSTVSPEDAARLDAIDPTTGNREEWLKAQPQWKKDLYPQIANGSKPFPSMNTRNRDASEIQKDMSRYAPDVGATAFSQRKAYEDTLHGIGGTMKTVIAPAERTLNHGVSAVQAAEDMGFKDGDGTFAGDLAARTQNYLTYNKLKAQNDPRATTFDTATHHYDMETDKFFRGTGGVTDQSTKNSIKIDPFSTLSGIRGAVSTNSEFMKGQLDPYVDAYKRNTRTPTASHEDLLGTADSQAHKSLATINSWKNPENGRVQVGRQPATPPNNPPLAAGGVPQGLPAGATLVRPVQGGNLYQLPDGSQVVGP